MTEQNIEAPRPVSDWENYEVKGGALSCKDVYLKHLVEVDDLRQRQKAYVDSLPKDPTGALLEIHRTINDAGDIGADDYAPRAALEIIRSLATHNALDDSQHMRDAIIWLAEQGQGGLSSREASSQRAKDIALQFFPNHKPFRA